jgi:lysozyme
MQICSKITREQGLKLLEEREGKRREAYLDTKKIPTIGVGHTGPEVHLGLVWSDEQILEALRQDVKKCENAVNLYCVNRLEQHQFDALVSFIFNVGVNAFTRSTLLRKLNQGDFEGAAKEFDRWHIPAEITSRRNGEREQFKGTVFVARA